jgi:hypothetical protein
LLVHYGCLAFDQTQIYSINRLKTLAFIMFRDAYVEDVFTVLYHIFAPVLTSLGLARGGTHWSSANLSDGPESSFAEFLGDVRSVSIFEDNVSAASTVG